MGRKKRKVSPTDDAPSAEPVPPAPPPVRPPVDPRAEPLATKSAAVFDADDVIDKDIGKKDTGNNEKAKAATTAASSHYAMTSHGAEIVEEDIYVSDGSEDEDENVEVVLVGSKMGLMRRGLHQPLLVQPNLRQWVRSEATEGAAAAEETEEEQRKKEEEELAKLDPAERAARLLAEKQRKLEEAKESARRIESEENAGRDPCLFSKRTAFDIRFDQIDDKPWERGTGDLTDFFNYGLTVDDWLEYAEQQLTIRQELTDASRQKRPPDPNIVPVAPRKPKSQTPKVAVVGSEDGNSDDEEGDTENMDVDEKAPVIGPTLVKKEEPEQSEPHKDKEELEDNSHLDVPAGIGGAWGAGAENDSVLARLIEEQTQKENGGGPSTASHNGDAYSDRGGRDTFGDRGGRDNYSDKGQPEYDEASVQYSAAGDSYDGRGPPGGYDMDDQSHGSNWGHRSSYGYDDPSGGRGMQHQYAPPFRGRGRGRGRGGRGFGGRFNPYAGRGGRGRGPPPPGPGGPPPFPPPPPPPPPPHHPHDHPPPPPPWAGRGRSGGRGDFRRSSRDRDRGDDYGYYQR